MRRVSLAPLLLTLACSSAPAPRPDDAPTGRARRLAPSAPPDRRLPAEVRPEHYALEIAIDPRVQAFTGAVTIRVSLPRATDAVMLHGQGLSIERALVTGPDGVRQNARWVPVDEEEGLAAIVPDAPVGPGHVTLRIEWRAPFDEQLEGLYRVHHRDAWYAFTQFEAIWARRAFPCFDEPGFKTPFDVTLRVPRDLVAVANTRVIDERDGADGQRVLRFATTAPLPTYLLAWAVGPLDVVPAPPIPAGSVARPPLPLRGIAPRGEGRRLSFALREAAAIVPALEAVTGIAYPFDKLDLAALPDLEAGAMENAGLVTFQDEYLLIDDTTAGQAALADVSSTIAHELAHQWYGNLVTMAWWDDLWLNESLATWIEVRLTAQRHPEWSNELEALRHTHDIMFADGLASARRLRQPIASNDDIAGAFDWITYLKGAALLGMIEHWLGPDVLTRALRAYLADHRFGSARSDDLLAAIGQAAGRDVTTAMRGFLDQPGLPMVEVEPTCDAGHASVRLRQSPYRPIGSRADGDRRWQVPVCLRFDRGAADPGEQCVVVDGPEVRVDLESDRCPRWVMPDAAAAGYYRWSLPAAPARRLVDEGLAHLSVRERFSVGDAVVAAVWAGRTRIEDALPLFGVFARDPDAAVARSIHPLAWLLLDRLSDAETAPRLRAFVRGAVPTFPTARLAPAAGTPALSSAEVAQAEVRAWVAEDEALRRALVDRATRWLRGDAAAPTALAPELVELGLSLAASSGDASLFDRLSEALFASTDPLVRRRLLVALGTFRDRALAERARALELNPHLLVGEMGGILATQLAGEATRAAAWAWMRAHWSELERRLGPDLAAFWIGHLDGFCDADAARQIRSFFEPRRASLPGSPRLIDNTVESIELCAARVAAVRGGAHQFFAR